MQSSRTPLPARSPAPSWWGRASPAWGLLLLALLAGCAALSGQDRPPEGLDTPMRAAMQAGPVDVDPLFWRIEPQGGATIHVLGSIHFGPPEGWVLPQAIDRAFERSSALVVEVDDRGLTPEQAQAITMRYALAPRGSTLEDLLPPETFALLEQRFAEAGGSITPILPFRPWMIATLLTIGSISEVGFSPEQGIDRSFLDAAGEREVLQLESIESQLAIFGGLSPELDALFLAETLEQLSEVQEMMLALAEAWRRGNEPELARHLHESFEQDDPAHQEMRARMLVDRNISMAEQLAVLATEPARAGTEVFVVVGAAHFVGEDDVLSMLASKGLMSERVGPAWPPVDAP